MALVLTKTPEEVFAPTTAGGAPRGAEMTDAMVLTREIVNQVADAATEADLDSLEARVVVVENQPSLAPSIVASTWADLSAKTGSASGQRGEARGPDVGTHTDPVVGGSVANTGVFSWSASPAGWKRIGNLDTATDVRSDVGTNPAGVGGGLTLFQKTADLARTKPAFTIDDLPNLLDPNLPTSEWGKYYSISTGNIGTAANYGTSGDIVLASGQLHFLSLDDAPAGYVFGSPLHCYNGAGTLVVSLDPAVNTSEIWLAPGARQVLFLTRSTVTKCHFNYYNPSGDAPGFLLAKQKTMLAQAAHKIPTKPFADGASVLKVDGLAPVRRNFAAVPATRNLYDPDTRDAGWSAGSAGSASTGNLATGTAMANRCFPGLMPVRAGQKYTFTVAYGAPAFYITQNATYWNADRSYNGVVATGAALAFADNFRTAIFTPAIDGFVSFSIAFLGSNPTQQDFKALRYRMMLCEGGTRLPFEPFAAPDAVAPGPLFGGGQIVAFMGDYVLVREAFSEMQDAVEALFTGDDGTLSKSGTAGPYQTRLIAAGTLMEDTVAAWNASTNMPKSSGDDAVPSWPNGLALGGNHGFLAKSVTATAHGKTNVDIGSRWTDGASKVWVLAAVVDANTLVITELPGGTATKWTFTAVLTGATLTHSAGATHAGAIAFSSPVDTQLRPWIQSQKVRVILDGTREVRSGVHMCNRIDVAQSYNIPNARAVVDNLVASVGATTDPVYNKASIQSQMAVNITYSKRPGELMTVAYEALNIQDYTMLQLLGMQAGVMEYGSDKLFLHIPGTKAPKDYSTPVDITALAATVSVDSGSWVDPNDPPSRFATIRKTSGGDALMGFLMGYSHLVGVGKPSVRKNSVNAAIDIFSSKKMYPHAADAGDATAGDAGAFRCLLGYRGIFDATADADIIHQGVYSLAGKQYWILHLRAAALTNVWKKPPFAAHRAMIGKKISLVGNGIKSAALTLSSEVVSERGVLLSATTAGDWMIAEIG